MLQCGYENAKYFKYQYAYGTISLKLYIPFRMFRTIRLRVYHHSFIATVYLVKVAIKEYDELVV